MNELLGMVYIVCGNYDKVVVGIDDGVSFNVVVFVVVCWMMECMSFINLKFV